MVIWRILHLRRILHAPGAISVHGGVSPGEPRYWAHGSGPEWSAAGPPRPLGQNGPKHSSMVKLSRELPAIIINTGI